MNVIEDQSYGPDKYEYKYEYDSYNIPTPPSRKYGNTAFFTTNQIYAKHGINSLEDLIAKAEQWYPGSGYETDFSNRNYSLNKYV